MHQWNEDVAIIVLPQRAIQGAFGVPWINHRKRLLSPWCLGGSVRSTLCVRSDVEVRLQRLSRIGLKRRPADEGNRLLPGIQEDIPCSGLTIDEAVIHLTYRILAHLLNRIKAGTVATARLGEPQVQQNG